jgi:hypothetical protein
MNYSFRYLPGIIVKAALVLSLSPLFMATIAQAQIKFNPPPMKAPGNREAGASRSDTCAATAGGSGLTAILPTSNLGLTTKAYPTFFAYIPPNNAQGAEFRLIEESTNKEVYTGKLQLPVNNDAKATYKHPTAILNLSVPARGPEGALEPDKKYVWAVMLICNPKNRAEDIVVTGVVQRVGNRYLQTLDPNVRIKLSKIDQASPQEQVLIYGLAGIWNDMLSQAINLENGKKEFRNLLGGQGLKSIADVPIFNSNLVPVNHH